MGFEEETMNEFALVVKPPRILLYCPRCRCDVSCDEIKLQRLVGEGEIDYETRILASSTYRGKCEHCGLLVNIEDERTNSRQYEPETNDAIFIRIPKR